MNDMKIADVLKAALPEIEGMKNFVSEIIRDLDKGKYVKVEYVALALTVVKTELSFTKRTDLIKLVTEAEVELLAA